MISPWLKKMLIFIYIRIIIGIIVAFFAALEFALIYHLDYLD